MIPPANCLYVLSLLSPLENEAELLVEHGASDEIDSLVRSCLPARDLSIPWS